MKMKLAGFYRIKVNCLMLFSMSLILAACAPRNGTFNSLQAVLEQKAGIETQWRELTGDVRSDEAVRALLSRPLGADDAVQIALLNNPAIQSSFEELEISRFALVEARLPPNIEFGGSFVSLSGGNASEFELELSTDLADLIFLPMRRDIATAKLDATKFGTASLVLKFTHSVRTAFYSYQAAKQQVELAQAVSGNATASYEVALRLREAGNITSLELANTQAFYEEVRIDLTTSKSRAIMHREKLNWLMGWAGAETEWELAGQLDPPPARELPLESLESHALHQNLDLLELEYLIAAAERRSGLARAESILPSLRAGILVGKEERFRETGVGISLELPLFNRGQGRVGLAEAEIRLLEQRYRNQVLAIRSAVRTVSNELTVAKERVQQYQKLLLPLRQQIVDATQRHYNVMQAGIFQLLSAKREQIRTGQDYVVLLRDYWHARATLDLILNGRLVSDLGKGDDR